MTELHPAATRYINGFIVGPGQTDILMVVAAILLGAAILLAGVMFFWLHSLPERRAHKYEKFQLDLIGVLCLLALFTHIHVFWVAALILAFLKIPQIGLPGIEIPLGRIANTLESRNETVGPSASDERPLNHEKS